MKVEITGTVTTYAVELDGAEYTVVEMWDSNTDSTQTEYFDSEGMEYPTPDIQSKLDELIETFKKDK